MKIWMTILIFFVAVQQSVYSATFPNSYGDTQKGNTEEYKLFSHGIKSSSSNNLPSDVSFKYIYRRSNSGKVGNIKKSTVLKSGDCHRIEFTPNCSSSNCYVYIVQFDANGKVQMLFPTEGIKNPPRYVKNVGRNPVNTGETYFVPGQDRPDERGYFCLDNSTGKESVHIIVSDNSRKDLIVAYEDSFHTETNTMLAEMGDIPKGNMNIVKTYSENNGKATKVNEITCSTGNECRHVITFTHN